MTIFFIDISHFFEFQKDIPIYLLSSNPANSFKLPFISLILGKDQHHGDIELIKLGAVNNEVPLVIVGPGAFVYHLADEMKQSRPVYAFTLPNYVEVLAWKDDAAMITVDKLATIYTDLILKHIPAGRLMLAGHSFHGIIAFEVAQQLIKSGKNIEMIVMFDTKLKKQYPKLLPRMLYFIKILRPDLAIKALILRVFAIKKSADNKKIEKLHK